MVFGSLTTRPLRSLSVELLRSNLSVEDAREGVNILDQLQRLGIRPEDHKTLVAAVIRMSELDEAAGGSYEEVLSRYVALSRETGSLQEAKARAETGLAALRGQHEHWHVS